MENSTIEWTDHTFNPWIGCTKVSAGCKHCYAETLMNKRYGRVEWGANGTRVRTSAANWKKPLAWDRKALSEGRRYRVFCASLADVFEDKPDQPEVAEWQRHLFNLIDATPNLYWLLLTKRPENIIGVTGWAQGIPSNVWLGTSVENQEQADKRIPELAYLRAPVKFLSVEPMLGAIDLERWLLPEDRHESHGIVAGNSLIDWVIVGGESGANARPMHPDWARAIRDQCIAADVPLLFKQWGEWAHTPHGFLGSAGNNTFLFTDGSTAKSPIDFNERRGSATMSKIGKKAAGRLLDGRTWDEFPTP